MFTRSRSIRLLISLLLVGAITFGVVAVTSETEAAGGCFCPLIYAPVICKGGKVYSNQCIADCHHARDCVPLGGPIE